MTKTTQYNTYNTEDWESAYDFQKADTWDKKYATVKIYTHRLELLSHAFVENDVTGEIKKKYFSGETCESDALRWASDIATKIVYGK